MVSRLPKNLLNCWSTISCMLHDLRTTDRRHEIQPWSFAPSAAHVYRIIPVAVVVVEGSWFGAVLVHRFMLGSKREPQKFKFEI